MNFSVQPSRQFLTLVVVFFLFSFYSFGQSIRVGTIDDLRSLQPGSAQEVTVEGYHTAGDGGGGTFSWNASSREQDNGGTIIIPKSNPSQGRWIRDTSGYDHYNVKWFGARGQDNANHNDHIFIFNCIEAAVVSSDINKVFFPVGIYQIGARIRLYKRHSGLTLEGENLAFKYEEVYPTTVGEDGNLMRLEHPRVHIHWSEVNEFRTVDEVNSAVLKKADGFFDAHWFTLYGTDGVITNLTIRNLAFNGNRWQTKVIPYPEGEDNSTNIQTLSNSTNSSVRFENIATYLASKHGFHFYSPINIDGILVYSNNHHGIVGYPRNTNEPSKINNVEIHHCGHDEQLANYYSAEKDWYGGFNGMDVGGNVEVDNIWSHHNSEGMKTIPSGNEYVKIKNGVFEYNRRKGIQHTAREMSALEVSFIGETISKHNGDAGFRNVQSKNVFIMGKLYLKNNGINPMSSGMAALFVKNLTADEIIIEDNVKAEKDGFNHAVILLGNNDISNIEILNNELPGLRIEEGITTIRSGEVFNNNSVGISINNEAQLEIINVKFGDTQQNPTQTQHEISGSGATLKYGNLDFSESQVSQSNRINVVNVQETGAIYIDEPGTGVLINEEKEIAITTVTSHPSARITKVEFYADGTKIGERTEAPYTFTWTDIPSGSYRITARATFDDNSTAESNAVRVYVSGRHTIILNEGWNNISSFIDPGEKAIESVFKRVENNVSLVNNNNGDVYWPLYDINEIGNWNYHEGYQVFMHAPDTLVLYGKHMVPEATPIQLSGGWNLTSYLPDQPMPVDKALESIGSSLEIVTNNTGDIYWPDYDVNTLEYMYPGEGYKVFLSQAAPLTYPNGDEPAFKLANTKMGHDNSTTNSTPEIYKLKSGITGSSAILLVESDFFRAGDEVGVWNAAGALVGSGVVKNKKAAITVWGRNKMDEGSSFGAEQNEPLRLTVWHNDRNEEHDLTVQEVVCIGRGELDDPSIRYEENTAMLVNVRHPEEIPDRYTLHQNFPNPFNPSTTIQYHIPRDESVTLTVYNLLGQKVETLVDERQQAGSYEILFKADQLASGVYFYRLRAGNYTEVKRMILLR